MKRQRLVGIAVVALALAGLLSLSLYQLLRHSVGAAAAPRLTSVVAAALALPPGKRLQSSDLKVLRLPAGDLPAHVYAQEAQLQGKVLTVVAVPNQVIVGEMVAGPGAGVGLPPLIPPGMRAVSVKVNDVVSVAGFAVPGTHVDVLFTGNPSANQNPRTITTVTLLSNVQVLTAGQQMEKSPDGKPEQVAVITLLVTPEGAEKLALADGYGHIQLALRNPLDAKAQSTPPVLNASLFDGEPARQQRRRRRASGARVKVAEAPQPWAVNVIVGGQHQKVAFPPLVRRGGQQ